MFYVVAQDIDKVKSGLDPFPIYVDFGSILVIACTYSYCLTDLRYDSVEKKFKWQKNGMKDPDCRYKFYYVQDRENQYN